MRKHEADATSFPPARPQGESQVRLLELFRSLCRAAASELGGLPETTRAEREADSRAEWWRAIDQAISAPSSRPFGPGSYEACGVVVIDTGSQAEARWLEGLERKAAEAEVRRRWRLLA